MGNMTQWLVNAGICAKQNSIVPSKRKMKTSFSFRSFTGNWNSQLFNFILFRAETLAIATCLGFRGYNYNFDHSVFNISHVPLQGTSDRWGGKSAGHFMSLFTEERPEITTPGCQKICKSSIVSILQQRLPEKIFTFEVGPFHIHTPLCK